MLVRCNSCSREISHNAQTCPHCGQPDPYTEADARLDAAIHKHVEKQMSRESYVVIGCIGVGVLWGWAQGGGLGAFLGFMVGGIVATVINKVMGWFS